MLNHLLICALFCFPASAALAEDKIDSKLLVGKWEPETLPDGVEKMILEFTKDKVTLAIEGDQGKQTLEGTYKVEGSRLAVTLKVDEREQKQTRKITRLTENELVTTNEENQQERKYRKVK